MRMPDVERISTVIIVAWIADCIAVCVLATVYSLI